MHLVSLADHDDEWIEAILHRAHAFEGNPSMQGLDDRVVCSAFFEPSTRTRLSFESAAIRLGASVVGFSDAAATSTAKGESLEDTGRVLSGYADLIVLRHPETGAARRFAASARVPVVNAGDGAGEHPTQALVDLYTINKERGGLEGVKVAVVGDLRYGRTIHSLVPALRRFGAQVVAVPAPGLGMGGDVPEVSLEDALASCDVLYATRVQRERLPHPGDHGDAEAQVLIDRRRLEDAGFDGIVLHPLPRRQELADDVDDHPSAKYFDQARNGVPVRMAVLATLMEGWS